MKTIRIIVAIFAFCLLNSLATAGTIRLYQPEVTDVSSGPIYKHNRDEMRLYAIIVLTLSTMSCAVLLGAVLVIVHGQEPSDPEREQI
jgi:nucleoside permease NupC